MLRNTRSALSQLPDEELMSRLCAVVSRDTTDALFDEIFARYHQRVIAWCFRVTKDYDYATDLAQEVFLKAFRHSSSFRGDSRLSTWLFSIARNHCLSAIKRKNDETVPLEAATLSVRGHKGDPGPRYGRTNGAVQQTSAADESLFGTSRSPRYDSALRP